LKLTTQSNILNDDLK